MQYSLCLYEYVSAFKKTSRKPTEFEQPGDSWVVRRQVIPSLSFKSAKNTSYFENQAKPAVGAATGGAALQRLHPRPWSRPLPASQAGCRLRVCCSSTRTSWARWCFRETPKPRTRRRSIRSTTVESPWAAGGCVSTPSALPSTQVPAAGEDMGQAPSWES